MKKVRILALALVASMGILMTSCIDENSDVLEPVTQADGNTGSDPIDNNPPPTGNN